MNENRTSDTALPKVYDPFQVEEKWYEYWLGKRYFHAEVEPGRERYCITIPPPNVTGSLHTGHALCYTIHDVLVRWRRMKGLNTLCLPGTDHAGIGTQMKIEQQLAEEGTNRFELGRDRFIERAWKWKQDYGGTIISQLKRLGCSFDWERERFTMDEGYAEAVLESFVRMFEKGLIYRGTRVINWCPSCGTGISDLEVDYVEEHSHLWYINYPLADGSGCIQVATTRPETMLGDTAVAVNPDDRRYTDYIGKTAILPIMEREIPIIDDGFVDPEFGTGAVKVTPAHDPNDFEIGLRHNLEQVVVIGTDGRMTQAAGKCGGLDRYEARRRVVEELKHKGLLASVEDYVHSVGTCKRCGTIVEPLLSEQWFVRMKELAQPAIDVVQKGKVRFVPERYARTYLDWMENVRDWCISRQLWWGHRIPVWKCGDCGEYTAARGRGPGAGGQADGPGYPCPGPCCRKCGSKDVEQEPDVLDTWFSSALWPFATLGWPKKTAELECFYPTNVLITARDIIYLWVSRMIFQSLQFLEEIPFYDVYIYPMVLNQEGRRMSKSLGTGVDPLDLIERFGADALRYALVQQAGTGQDIRFSDSLVENTRNFGNKIWNISRFVLMNLDSGAGGQGSGVGPNAECGMRSAESLKLEDKWILSRLNRVIKTVNDGLANYDMGDAARSLYEFLWSEFADWYVELAKPRLRTDESAHVQYMLWHVLETSMRLLHPIMPFITEEIWQALPHEGESIVVARFPEADESLVDEEAEVQMSTVMEAVRLIRNLRAEVGVAPGKTVDVITVAERGTPAGDVLSANADGIRRLARAGSLEVTAQPPAAGRREYVVSHGPGFDVYLRVAGLVDVDRELQRLDSELASVEKELARSSAKLANEQFLSRAPADVVEKERRIKAELEERKAKLEERRRALGGVARDGRTI